MEHNAAREAARTGLVPVTRELDRHAGADDGVSAQTLKDKIADLERRKAELCSQLDQTSETPVLEHPNMSGYRERITGLRHALNDPAPHRGSGDHAHADRPHRADPNYRG
jgi:hypothetical protein